MAHNADEQGDGQGGCSQPGEASPGEVAAAGLQDTSIDRDLAAWMEQGDAACLEVLAFASHTSIASIFLNISSLQSGCHGNLHAEIWTLG